MFQQRRLFLCFRPLLSASQRRRTGTRRIGACEKLIDDYCREEFHSGADFSDLSAVAIGHTTVTDDEIPIQAYANLTDFRIENIWVMC